MRVAEGSAGEAVTQWCPGARVVKAFNTVGFNIMENPRFGEQRAVMFLCGNEDGKPTVQALADEMDFETVDAGSIESARMLESFALLWIHGAYKFGMGRDYAFALARRSEQS